MERVRPKGLPEIHLVCKWTAYSKAYILPQFNCHPAIFAQQEMRLSAETILVNMGTEWLMERMEKSTCLVGFFYRKCYSVNGAIVDRRCTSPEIHNIISFKNLQWRFQQQLKKAKIVKRMCEYSLEIMAKLKWDTFSTCKKPVDGSVKLLYLFTLKDIAWKLEQNEVGGQIFEESHVKKWIESEKTQYVRFSHSDKCRYPLW